MPTIDHQSDFAFCNQWFLLSSFDARKDLL